MYYFVQGAGYNSKIIGRRGWLRLEYRFDDNGFSTFVRGRGRLVVLFAHVTLLLKGK